MSGFLGSEVKCCPLWASVLFIVCLLEGRQTHSLSCHCCVPTAVLTRGSVHICGVGELFLRPDISKLELMKHSVGWA